MANNRLGRIEEEIRKALSDILRTEIKDPRIDEFISVTKVQTAKDLKLAKVYVSTFSKTNSKEEIIKALKSASSFIRHQLSTRVDLRNTPELKFEIDESIEHGIHISNLLKEVGVKPDEDNS